MNDTKPYQCPVCGGRIVNTSWFYSGCIEGCISLRPRLKYYDAPWANDMLPIGERIADDVVHSYKCRRYRLTGRQGVWGPVKRGGSIVWVPTDGGRWRKARLGRLDRKGNDDFVREMETAHNSLGGILKKMKDEGSDTTLVNPGGLGAAGE